MHRSFPFVIDLRRSPLSFFLPPTFLTPPPSTTATMVDSRIYTRRQIENLIAAGQTIIIFQNNVLRVSDAWKDRHPGGKLVLDHMIGRDATDEIDAWVYTSPSTPASLTLRGR